MKPSRSTSLYRFFDASGVLLYVGITERGAMRWHDHRQEKHWWPEVATSTIEHFETRSDAEHAERYAITTEGPLHNVVHNRGLASCRSVYLQLRDIQRDREAAWITLFVDAGVDGTNWRGSVVHLDEREVAISGVDYLYAQRPVSFDRAFNLTDIAIVRAVDLWDACETRRFGRACR